jgi:hypothetical protein
VFALAGERPLNGGAKFTLVVTNLTKVGGLVLALATGLGSHPDSRVLAVAALMMAGAQGLENWLTSMFGGPKK